MTLPSAPALQAPAPSMACLALAHPTGQAELISPSRLRRRPPGAAVAASALPLMQLSRWPMPGRALGKASVAMQRRQDPGRTWSRQASASQPIECEEPPAARTTARDRRLKLRRKVPIRTPESVVVRHAPLHF